MGRVPVTNREVLQQAGMAHLRQYVWEQQILTLGHMFRRPADSPVRNLAMDRFLNVRRLSGPRRPGLPRKTWLLHTLK
eukprot:2947398-Alexandrium_andersonii.AAC.1